MSKDSTFEVRVEIRTHAKGDEAVIRKEFYNEWQDADIAFCAYNELTNLPESLIVGVTLLELRKEVIHKSASKALEAA